MTLQARITLAIQAIAADIKALFTEAKRETICIAYSDETTNITTGTAKVRFRMPFAMTNVTVRGSLSTAASTGTHTVDINENGTSILSTRITILATQKTSTTATVQPVVSDPNLANDAEVTVDVDVSATGARGGKVYISGIRV